MAQPLKGIKVLDFSKVLAGPLCAQYMADMGAEVIKVEPLEHGDDTRLWPPFRQGEGTVFLSANRGKRSIALDLKSPKGREVSARLLKSADVALETFGPGVAARLGIDYESVRAINPKVVYCSISGFGSTGPMREGKGYDVILQAFSGMLSITGERGGNPVRSPFSPVDQATGLHALIGILAALLERSRTGKGTRVEASLFDTNAARVQRREETVKLVNEILRKRTREEWIRDLGQAGIPCSPVHTLGELSAHPHTTAVGMVYEYPASGPTPLKAVAQPVKFDGARTTAQRLPPRHGEHTREVLKEAGYSEAEILGFEEIGVVRS